MAHERANGMTSAEKSAGNWMKSDNLPRLAFAAVVSPPVAGALVTLILGTTVLGATVFSGSIADILLNIFNSAVGGVMLAGVIGWPIMLVFILPVHALLLRRTSARAWVYAATGGLAGAAAGMLLFVASRGAASAGNPALFLAIGLTSGVSGLLIFWIARRPDRDAARFKA
jgi:hypothetical protein